jgi:hypothetical protein
VQGNVSALIQIFNAIPSPPWRGNLLPPSNVRFALCLPFSGFTLRPRGHIPLESPTAFLQTLSLFSAPAELRMINPNHWSLSHVNPNLKPLELSCSIHPRRPTGSNSLAGWFEKAKSSMSLRNFPALLSLLYFAFFMNNSGKKEGSRR